MQSQRLPDRDGMSHTRLWLVGRYYHYFSKVFYSFNEIHDARRSDAIIVGDQDNWLLLFSAGLWPFLFLYRSFLK